MTENSTKVTVLMPAYNAEKYIAEAIQSVLQQTFRDFRLLIVDDGSTDNTLQIVQSFSDNRIDVIHQSHKGIAAALNKGLLKTASEYIARFDADDICFPERLLQQVSFLDSHPDYIIVGPKQNIFLKMENIFFISNILGHTHEQIIRKIYSSARLYIHR